MCIKKHEVHSLTHQSMALNRTSTRSPSAHRCTYIFAISYSRTYIHIYIRCISLNVGTSALRLPAAFIHEAIGALSLFAIHNLQAHSHQYSFNFSFLHFAWLDGLMLHLHPLHTHTHTHTCRSTYFYIDTTHLVFKFCFSFFVGFLVGLQKYSSLKPAASKQSGKNADFRMILLYDSTPHWVSESASRLGVATRSCFHLFISFVAAIFFAFLFRLLIFTWLWSLNIFFSSSFSGACTHNFLQSLLFSAFVATSSSFDIQPPLSASQLTHAHSHFL